MKTKQPNVELIEQDEIFKTVRISNEYYKNYLISNYGRVYSLNVERFIYHSIDNHGYVRYKLRKNGKTKYISGQRLVAFSFVKNYQPNIYNTVNHLDENPLNNKWTNLEWTNDKGNLNWASAQERRAAQRRKKVLQYDLNNKLIAEFSGLPEVNKKLGYSKPVIWSHIKSGIPYDGYYWSHAS